MSHHFYCVNAYGWVTGSEQAATLKKLVDNLGHSPSKKYTMLKVLSASTYDISMYMPQRVDFLIVHDGLQMIRATGDSDLTGVINLDWQ